jgi:hypothetical protein
VQRFEITRVLAHGSTGGFQSSAVVGELFAGFADLCDVVAQFLAVFTNLGFAGAATNLAAQLSAIFLQLGVLFAQLFPPGLDFTSRVANRLIVFARYGCAVDNDNLATDMLVRR